MAVGFPAKTNFATGEVLTATNVNDITGTLNLLESAQYAAGKNKIINGNFQIWQRGTSFSSPIGLDYLADRWNCNGGSGGTTTISQQTTGVPVGSQYCMRTAYGAASSYNGKAQILDTNTTRTIIGNTVTFQVKLRKNASFASGINVRISKSATVDAGIAATWTIIQTTLVANASLPTGTTSADWYTATVTAAIPNDGTANSVKCVVEVVSAGASGEYWEMAQAQLEIGSTASPFQTASGSVGGELALCQRYYVRFGGDVLNSQLGNGKATSTTLAYPVVTLPVTLRTAAVSVDFSTIVLKFDAAAGVIAATACTILNSGQNKIQLTITVAAGLVVASTYDLMTNNLTSGYLGFSAEL